jgi:hypothetical protein
MWHATSSCGCHAPTIKKIALSSKQPWKSLILHGVVKMSWTCEVSQKSYSVKLQFQEVRSFAYSMTL